MLIFLLISYDKQGKNTGDFYARLRPKESEKKERKKERKNEGRIKK